MSTAHLIGQKVGEYEVIRRIGLGGMGAVFEGLHPLIGKRVAIKVLLPQFSEDEALVRRFLAEARAVNEIRHRGIVDIFAFGELPDGAHYFVMEFLEGQSFEALLKSRRVLPVSEALSLVEEVLDAVSAAHQAGVVHRDLKPSNLFLVDVGRGRPFVKLLDFGVAKLSQRGEQAAPSEATGIVGTPIYMSPEQINGGRVGPQTDLYALGVVLFELVTGRPPFEASNPVEMMSRHVDSRPPRASEVKRDVPIELDRIIDRMLMKRPQDRPADAESLRAELASLKQKLESGGRRSAGSGPIPAPALEDDIGPTVVRAAPRPPPGATHPDITPVGSPAARAAEREEAAAQGARGVTPEEAGPGATRADLSGAEEDEFDAPPTQLEPRQEVVGPVPKLRANSQSAPTLSAPRYAEHSLGGMKTVIVASGVAGQVTQPDARPLVNHATERAPPVLRPQPTPLQRPRPVSGGEMTGSSSDRAGVIPLWVVVLIAAVGSVFLGALFFLLFGARLQ